MTALLYDDNYNSDDSDDKNKNGLFNKDALGGDSASEDDEEADFLNNLDGKKAPEIGKGATSQANKEDEKEKKIEFRNFLKARSIKLIRNLK